MIEDDILKDLRAVREAFARSHNYDVAAMVADLRARDRAVGNPGALIGAEAGRRHPQALCSCDYLPRRHCDAARRARLAVLQGRQAPRA
jgi:hypothetical protein